MLRGRAAEAVDLAERLRAMAEGPERLLPVAGRGLDRAEWPLRRVGGGVRRHLPLVVTLRNALA